MSPKEHEPPSPLSPRVFDRQFELLKLELTLIDNAIRSLDEITKNIKQWAIVTWTGAMGLALRNPTLKPSVWATALVAGGHAVSNRRATVRAHVLRQPADRGAREDMEIVTSTDRR
jgi:hypothetical protein